MFFVSFPSLRPWADLRGIKRTTGWYWPESRLMINLVHSFRLVLALLGCAMVAPPNTADMLRPKTAETLRTKTVEMLRLKTAEMLRPQSVPCELSQS